MELPTTREGLLRELERFARCPVVWDIGDRFAEPEEFLQHEWVEVYRLYGADREARWIDDPYPFSRYAAPEPASEPIPDLRADVSNFRIHGARATEAYVKRTRRFWALRAADPRVQSKHYPPAGASWGEILEKSRGGKSLLKPGIGPGQILEAFWTALVHVLPAHDVDFRQQLRDRLFHGTPVRLAVSTLGVTGAAYGHETHNICFEVDASTPLLHAYPVDAEEAEEIRGSFPAMEIEELDGLDDLQQRALEQRSFGALRSDEEE